MPALISEHTIGERGIATKITSQLSKMRHGEKDILPAIVIKVVDAEPPSGELTGAHQQAGSFAVILKTALGAEISKQQEAVVDHPVHYDIRMPIVIDVAPIRSHPGDGDTVIAKRDSGFEADFAKRAAALIAEKEVAHGIVGDEDVGESVAIHVRKGHAHALADVSTDSGLQGNVSEGSIVVV